MAIQCSDIVKYIEMIAPPALAEDYDNVGLLLGTADKDVQRVLVCLDVNEINADHAVSAGCDMIISHHPIIFNKLNRIDSSTPKGRILYKLIKNDISVYSAHTNFDTADEGLNQILAEKLGMSKIEGLNRYENNRLYKLAVYVPVESLEGVIKAVSDAGAGWIGNYSDCMFRTEGMGTFRPLDNAHPYIGQYGVLEQVGEYKLETVVKASNLQKVISAMLKAHPYEEVAYDLYKLENGKYVNSLGRVGYLNESVRLDEFANRVKKILGTSFVRIVGHLDKMISKAAVFCGSFDGDWSGYKRTGADVLVTGDVKYHQAAEAAELGICIIDAGHFATERIFADYFSVKLKDKFPDTEFIVSSLETDPFICY